MHVNALLQGIEMVALPAGLVMPISWGSLPFDIAFFVAGLAAARGRLLELITQVRCTACCERAPSPPSFPALASQPDAPLLSRWERMVAWAVVTVVALACFCLGAAAFASGGGAPAMPVQACGDPAPPFQGSLGTLSAVLAFAAAFGVYAVCISLALLDACARHAAGPHPPWLRAASRAAFAAYLVHPWVLIPAQWAYVAAVVAPGSGGWPVGVPGAVFPSGACLNGPDGGSGALLWGGFFAVSAVAVPGSFLAGAGLVRLPLLRDVL